MRYRRTLIDGASYFFTVVTHERRPLFKEEANRRFLGEAMRAIQAKRPFRAFATVLLPDHFHLWLALSDAESTINDRDAQHRRGLAAAALLDAIGITRLVYIEACVIWFD